LGIGAPAGQTAMNPGALVFATVMFAETTWAVAGMPHLVAIGKTRGAPATSEGGPKGPGGKGPPVRVSARRQGAIAMNAIGGVGTPSAAPANAWST
jgi:hypothetical protein